METNVRFKKLLRDFKESALGIYIYISFWKRDLWKLRLAENWKDSFSGGYLSFRGTHLSFPFQWDISFAALWQHRHMHVGHDRFICVTSLIRMCDMTDSYMWHDSFICVRRLVHMCDMTHVYVWHDSFICVTWLTTDTKCKWKCRHGRMHVCHDCLYVWHDSLQALDVDGGGDMDACLCAMTHLYIWHDSLQALDEDGGGDMDACMCAMTHLYVWHDWLQALDEDGGGDIDLDEFQGLSSHFNTLQHTATHCKTLQHTPIHCNTLQRTRAHVSRQLATFKIFM